MDQVILVDENDNEIGVMDKIEAHRGAGKLHRASSVFLFNKAGKLLIQKRSDKKIVGAGQWANTCCGNVRPGETYEECALRRLREELGIDCRGESRLALKKVTKFLYQARCNEEFSEYEMDTVFVGRYDGDVKPNPGEVKEYKWINWEDFKKRVERAESSGEFILAPWVKIMGEKKVLQKVGELYV